MEGNSESSTWRSVKWSINPPSTLPALQAVKHSAHVSVQPLRIFVWGWHDISEVFGKVPLNRCTSKPVTHYAGRGHWYETGQVIDTRQLWRMLLLQSGRRILSSSTPLCFLLLFWYTAFFSELSLLKVKSPRIFNDFVSFYKIEGGSYSSCTGFLPTTPDTRCLTPINWQLLRGFSKYPGPFIICWLSLS